MWCLLSLVLLAHLARIDAATEAVIPEFNHDYNSSTLPEWVQGRDNSMFWREFARNKEQIKSIDDSGKRGDMLLLGDSITAWNKPVDLSKVPGSRDVWEDNFGDLLAEPNGIPGDRISTVVWRLAVGKERPRLDPKVIVIFVGINDVVHKTPNIPERMDFLLGWLRSHMPRSELVVQLLLPSLSPAIGVNIDYILLARKHNATVSHCMQDMRKNNRKYMADILHPNVAGQARLQRCLRKVIQPLLDRQTD